MSGQHYSMGFAFSHDEPTTILLLKKARPAFLADMWMGLAGHVEDGETPLQAMRREAKEEGNLDVEDWTYLGTVEGHLDPTARIHMFATRTDLSEARALTDEPVEEFLFDHDTLRILDLGPAVDVIIPRLCRFIYGETEFDGEVLKNIESHEVAPGTIYRIGRERLNGEQSSGLDLRIMRRSAVTKVILNGQSHIQTHCSFDDVGRAELMARVLEEPVFVIADLLSGKLSLKIFGECPYDIQGIEITVFESRAKASQVDGVPDKRADQA